MMIKDGGKKKSGKKRFGKVKILYAVLGVSAIAVSLLSYSAMKDVRKSTENSLTAYSDEKTTATQKPPVTQAVTQLAVEQTEAKPQPVDSGAAAVFGNNAQPVAQDVTQEATTEPEPEKKFDSEKCILPFTATVSKDYSLGYPVYSQTMGDWRTHNGVDFTGIPGEEVPSMADCTVTAVYQDDLWGGVVETDCCGVMIKYCGLTFNEMVAVGDELSAGESLGTLGSIPVEAGDGSHIHIEMRIDGALCDPLELLNRSENDID